MNKMPVLFQLKNSLGTLEFTVMKIIWGKDNFTVREVVNLLKQKRSVAYTTVMTVMDNLYKKGFLKRIKIKKSYFYSPVTPKDQIVSFSLESLLTDLTADYGTGKVFYSLSTAILPTFSFTFTPAWYGMSLTVLLALLTFSIYDLFENLRFFGAFDYLSVLPLNTALSMDHFLFTLDAFFESLPVVNLVTVMASFILAFVVARKLAKVVSFNGWDVGGAI